MKLINLENRKVEVNLYVKPTKERGSDNFICQRIMLIDGVHRFEKKGYTIKEIEDCVKSAEILADKFKDNDSIKIIVEIYLDLTEQERIISQKNEDILNRVNKKVKHDRFISKISKLIWRFMEQI